MSIKKITAALAVIAGTVGFTGKADAQVIYRSGGYYSSPGVVYSSGYTPGVVYGSGYTPGVIYGSGYTPGVVYGSGYGVMPNYNTGILSGGLGSTSTSGYLGGTSLYSNGLYGNSLYGNGLGMYSGVNGYNNLYGNAYGTGLNVGTRGATYNGIRLFRR